MMIGTSIKELKDKMLNGHEAEFTYEDKEFSIESERSGDECCVRIWECGIEPKCMLEEIVRKESDLDALFSKKIFQGKSFSEIEKKIVVENIF
jgi:hypothetical protein